METQAKAATAKTLLIVEDDVLPAIALQEALEDAGYIVLDLTGRHLEALAAARANKPDLALVNIELEGRDDGIELAEDLKAMGVPVLFISGQVSRARTARTTAIGSLPKPYSSHQMVQAVGHLLSLLEGDKSQPRPEHLEVFGPAVDDLETQPPSAAA
jgi:DNA-binding response OmpR family regulator